MSCLRQVPDFYAPVVYSMGVAETSDRWKGCVYTIATGYCRCSNTWILLLTCFGFQHPRKKLGDSHILLSPWRPAFPPILVFTNLILSLWNVIFPAPTRISPVSTHEPLGKLIQKFTSNKTLPRVLPSGFVRLFNLIAIFKDLSSHLSFGPGPFLKKKVRS